MNAPCRSSARPSRIDSNLWEARYDLGVVLARAGDLAGAEDAARRRRPSCRPTRRRSPPALAEVRRRRGEHKLAAEGLADFVQAHPNAVDARTLYVAALRESGQVDKAIVEAREVLVRKPADATALAELALSHLAKGEKEAAALLAKQALDASPNSAVAHRATGLLDPPTATTPRPSRSFARRRRPIRTTRPRASTWVWCS